MSNNIWIRVEQPEKFTKEEKEILKDKIISYCSNYENLKKRTKKVEIKTGRAYLYEHFEVNTSRVIGEKTLVEGKYKEIPFARITIYDKKYEKCSAEYQQYNGKWFSLTEENLDNCIKYIAKNEGMFY